MDADRYRVTWNVRLAYLGDGKWADYRRHDEPAMTFERIPQKNAQPSKLPTV